LEYRTLGDRKFSNRESSSSSFVAGVLSLPAPGTGSTDRRCRRMRPGPVLSASSAKIGCRAGDRAMPKTTPSPVPTGRDTLCRRGDRGLWSNQNPEIRIERALCPRIATTKADRLALATSRTGQRFGAIIRALTPSPDRLRRSPSPRGTSGVTHSKWGVKGGWRPQCALTLPSADGQPPSRGEGKAVASDERQVHTQPFDLICYVYIKCYIRVDCYINV
jgi:hypothetical protein